MDLWQPRKRAGAPGRAGMAWKRSGIRDPLGSTHTDCVPRAYRSVRLCDATEVASKYDDYWLNRRSELAGAIEHAAAGEEGALDVAGLGELGQRRSWYGSATVQASAGVDAKIAVGFDAACVTVCSPPAPCTTGPTWSVLKV